MTDTGTQFQCAISDAFVAVSELHFAPYRICHPLNEDAEQQSSGTAQLGSMVGVQGPQCLP